MENKERKNKFDRMSYKMTIRKAKTVMCSIKQILLDAGKGTFEELNEVAIYKEEQENQFMDRKENKAFNNCI